MAVFSVNAVYSLIVNYKGNNIIRESQNVITPTTEAIQDFILLVTRSKMLITNWVYMKTYEPDKEALREIHQHEYIELKERIINLKPMIKETNSLVEVDGVEANLLDTAIVKMDSIFILFENILEKEQNIMNQLSSFDDYEDAVNIFMLGDILESEILPESAELIKRLDEIQLMITTQKSISDIGLMDNFDTLIKATSGLFIFLLVVGILTALIIVRSIVKPIRYLRQIIDKVAKGDLGNITFRKFSNDELGDMSKSVSTMATGFTDITNFAENIGNGKYESNFKPLSDVDMLGNALLEMRDNLKKVAEEDKKRNWATSGIAQFGDILRNHSDNLEKLTDEVISNLVKYVKANQGSIFIIDSSEDAEEKYMKMAACYAWDKRKFLEMKIYEGEGLAGQAWIEGDTIYRTDVPEDFITITSGLGEANPRSILIVPLKVNDEVHGILELASFKEFEEYEIDFIERIAENIASTISSVKVNARTQQLLQESTMMTEQMRAQEEEMRQNMEELQATQEKIQRDQQDRDSRERVLLSNMVTFELNKNHNIRKANDICKRLFNYSVSDLEGKHFKDLMMHSADLNKILGQVSEENYWSGVLKMKHRDGSEVNLLATIGIIQDHTYNDNIYIIYGKSLDVIEKEQ